MKEGIFMLTLEGKYCTAKIFTENIDQESINQILKLCNNLAAENSNLAIMPDVHVAKNCTIGTTMTVKDKIIPNLIGVDIGCGVRVEPIKVVKGLDWINEFDKKLRVTIPSGFSLRKKVHKFIKEVPLYELRCPVIDFARAEFSMGTLGEGNHYIEVSYDELGRYYLTIHSGSRNLGSDVAKYYQNLAYELLKKSNSQYTKKLKQSIQHLPKSDTPNLRQQNYHILKEFAYLDGEFMENYLHDMEIATEFAYWNRKAIAYDIIKALRGRVSFATEEDGYEAFDTVHNYIDIKTKILRKGAVSAQAGELLIIPINMRDGSILAIGKGNPKWNFSAPHGAGRSINRITSKNTITLSMFKKSMKGIHSTSICSSTIDESCFAYKNIDEIINNIQDSVDIIRIIKPIYNFKAI